MNAMGLPGIAFQAVTVSVADTAAKFPGQSIPAIRLTVTDRQAYRPVRTALLLIDTIQQTASGGLRLGAVYRRAHRIRWVGPGDRRQWTRAAAGRLDGRPPSSAQAGRGTCCTTEPLHPVQVRPFVDPLHQRYENWMQGHPR